MKTYFLELFSLVYKFCIVLLNKVYNMYSIQYLFFDNVIVHSTKVLLHLQIFGGRFLLRWFGWGIGRWGRWYMGGIGRRWGWGKRWRGRQVCRFFCILGDSCYIRIQHVHIGLHVCNVRICTSCNKTCFFNYSLI